MKNILLSMTLASVALSTTAALNTVQATEGLSANVGITSNYLWRGLEQTNGAAALSGGIDYTDKSGFYLGTWISNADWANNDMSYEMDIYGGYSANINDDLSYDVGFIYFAYPDETTGNADFSEVYVSLSFQALTLGVSVLTSGEGADFGDSIYANADYSIALANDSDITLHLGSYSGDWLSEDSIDYGVSFNKDGFTIGASATDLDGSAGDVKAYIAYSIDIEL
jgi:uncharacterized protein (TIGR02001 family)